MDEYIEREAAIRALLNDSPEQVNYSREDAADCVRYMDAADVAPVRHGRWEVVKGVFTPGGDPLLRCPLCKAKESEHLCGVESRVDWNYCPNCGAKMDAED